MENAHAVVAYNCLDVLHAALTHINFIFVEYLVKGVLFFKNGYLTSVKDWSFLVVTLLLHGGLNHVTFRWRFLFLFSCLLALGT